MGKLKIKIDSPNISEALLQEAYDEADALAIQAQKLLTAIREATELSIESIDGKAKFGKIVHDLLGDKREATKLKVDIAKVLMTRMQTSLSVPEQESSQDISDLDSFLDSAKDETGHKGIDYNVDKVTIH